MKNFNDLYLENKKNKALKVEHQSNEIADRLASDIMKLTSNEDFMRRAEHMLAEKGCFKISHSAIIVNDKIYITTSEYRPADIVFPKHKRPNIIDTNSPLVREKFDNEFMSFWYERGVYISFSYGNVIFVVKSLWDEAEERFEDEELDEAYFNTELFSPEHKFNKESELIDISQYVSGPFCYIKWSCAKLKT